jgi:hypothetical protein
MPAGRAEQGECGNGQERPNAFMTCQSKSVFELVFARSEVRLNPFICFVICGIEVQSVWARWRRSDEGLVKHAALHTIAQS